MKNKKLNVGFSFNFSKGSASNFLNGIRDSFEDQEIAKTSTFMNPFTSCNLYANKVRNPFHKDFFFRVDGVSFDLKVGDEQKSNTNESILYGLKKAKGVIFQSKFAQKLCESFLDYVPKNYEIILNGVDTTCFHVSEHNLRNELGIEENAIVFITSAKWRSHKRLKDMIEAFHLFRRSKPNSYFIIIGALEEEIAKKDHLILVDRIERELIPAYLRTADIFLFFSWLDNCPNSVIEAIACNLPVICTNQGGTKEIIEATQGGVVVEADEKFEFSEVDLYNPPKPNMEKILEAMELVSVNLKEFKNNINAAPISIDTIAKKYLGFIRRTYE